MWNLAWQTDWVESEEEGCSHDAAICARYSCVYSCSVPVEKENLRHWRPA